MEWKKIVIKEEINSLYMGRTGSSHNMKQLDLGLGSSENKA